MAQFKIMQKFDNKILQLTEKLKNNHEYIKAQDQFGSLDDQSQNFIKTLLPFAVLGIPLLIAFILWGHNSSLKEEAKLKSDIIERAQKIISVRASLGNAEGRTLGTGSITELDQFQQRIINAVSASAIDTAKLKLSNFSSTSLAGDISEARVDLKFTEFSGDELFGMLTSLNRNKMRVDTVQVRKSKENNLIEGLLSIIFFSRDIIIEEE